MSFLAEIAQMYAGADNLRRYTFVFPNHRAGIFFRKALAENISKPVFAPRTITITECFELFSDLETADNLTLIFELYKEYKRLAESREFNPTGDKTFVDTLDTFISKGRMLVSDFSEVDKYLVDNVSSLFQTIHDLHDIDTGFSFLSEEQKAFLRRFWSDYWLSAEKHTDNSLFHTSFVRLWSLLSPLYENFRARLRSKGLAYEGMLQREVAESGISQKDTHFVFIGFNALTPAERKLMLMLKDAGKADFFFDYSDPLLSRKDNRASLFVEDNLRDFRVSMPESAPLRSNTPKIRWIKVPSDVGQTYEVHRIVKDIVSDDANADLVKTAVVLPDEHLLIPLLRSIPEDVKTINVSMGYPLSATALWALIENLFRMQSSYRRGSFYYRDLLSVLRHPLIGELLGQQQNNAGDGSTKTADALQQFVVRSKRLFISKNSLATNEAAKILFAHPENAIEMTDYLQSVLTALAPDGEVVSDAQWQMQTTCNTLRQALVRHEDICADMGILTLFTLLKMQLSDAAIPFVGEPLQGLQVLGVLETRAIDFDNIIITSFNDDLYPGGGRQNSYIPYSIRRAFSLPTPERQDAIFAYNFYRMLSHAKNVWFITNTTSDDKNTGEPSRYLNQLRYQFEVEIEEEHVVFQPQSTEGYKDVIEKTADIMAILEKKICEDGISPSAINSYFRCPQIFYFQYVKGLRETEELDDDTAANAFGTWFHAIMEYLYTKPNKGGAERESEDNAGNVITADIINNILENLDSILDNLALLDPVRHDRLLMNVLKKYAANLLKFDLKFVPFEIKGLEKKTEKRLRLSNGKTAILKGTIDRIDRPLNSGTTIRVADYKTGKSENEYKSIEDLFKPTFDRNGYALQTLFYCYLCEEFAKEGMAIEPHLFSVRSLSADASHNTLVREKGKDCFSWDEVRNDYMYALDNFIVNELLCESIPFVKTEEKNRARRCKDCAYKDLCGE